MSTGRDAKPAERLTIAQDPGEVWRIGYGDDAWSWTPWEYADDNGRFPGRWDDPEGRFRTLYVGRTLLVCLLEVLARFRPDPHLAAAIDGVDDDPECPTAPAGAVPRTWLETRVVANGTLSGKFCRITAKESLATLRPLFLPAALAHGFVDLDAGVLRVAAPRSMTQSVAGWLYRQYAGDKPVADGVEFESRHGDGLTLWAIFERDSDAQTFAMLTERRAVDIDAEHPDIKEAFDLFRLRWAT
ncbi:MAG: RES domain-containing protein [Nakamurella sp.]